LRVVFELVSEAARHDLHEGLIEGLGPERAGTLMELLPPVGWGDIATKEHVDQRFDRLSERLDHLGERLDHQVGLLSERLDERVGLVNDRLDQQAGSLTDRLDRQAASLSERLDRQAASLNERLDQQVALIRKDLNHLDERLAGQMAVLRGEMEVGFAQGRASLKTELNETIRLWIFGIVGTNFAMASFAVGVLAVMRAQL
jgi:hypothetical protein